MTVNDKLKTREGHQRIERYFELVMPRLVNYVAEPEDLTAQAWKIAEQMASEVESHRPEGWDGQGFRPSS